MPPGAHGLQGLLRHAFETVTYYRERFAASGFDATKAITAEVWSRIPILTRDELQGSFAALCSRRFPKAHGMPSEIVTSGSTGKPVKVLGTKLTNLFWTVLTVRDHLWQHRDFSKALAAIRFVKGDGAIYPRGSRWKNWGSATASVFHTGPGQVLNVTTPVEQQLEWLKRQNADYLITYPSNLRALVRSSEQRGIGLSNLREVQTFAEVLVYVSHNMEEIIRLADWVVLISDGEAAAAGPVEEVMSRLDLRPMTGRYEAGAVLGVTRRSGPYCRLAARRRRRLGWPPPADAFGPGDCTGDREAGHGAGAASRDRA